METISIHYFMNKVRNLGKYAIKGAIPWNKGKISERFCLDCKKKISNKNSDTKRCAFCAQKGRIFSEQHRRNISKSHKGLLSGEKNPNWKGGKGSERHQAMGRIEYGLWRIAIFMRDNYTCVKCGSKGYLQADHIKPWSLYPELRYAIDNGRTLCLPCHQKTESFPKQLRKERG